VIAHEISHSWTGNSVGIQNFEHFWLNEGWTMFVQRKIESRLFGEKHRHFSAHLGLMELTDEVSSALVLHKYGLLDLLLSFKKPDHF
jgi:leukotriene-A4 hydrolase